MANNGPVEFKENILKDLTPEQIKECEEWLTKVNKILSKKLSEQQNEIIERIITDGK